MKRMCMLAVSLLWLVAIAAGQLTYQCDLPSDDSIPGWTEIKAPDFGSHIGSDGTACHLWVVGTSKEFWHGNQERLVWDGSLGYNTARAVWAYVGDRGRTGWIDSRTDGKAACRAWGSAPIVADFGFSLSLRKAPGSRLSLLVGDPVAYKAWPGAKDPPPPQRENFSFVMLAQRIEGRLRILEKKWFVAIPKDVPVISTLFLDGDTLRGTVEVGDQRLEIAAPVAGPSDPAGDVGIDVTLHPSCLCYFMDDGQLGASREVAIYRVETFNQ